MAYAQEQVGVCICCFDDEAVGHLRCALGHLLCDDCAGGLVQSQIGSAELRRRQGGLACQAMDGSHDACLQLRDTAFARTHVEPLLEDGVRKQYIAFLSPVEEQDDEAAKNLQHWVAELLNVTCPSCDAYLDPRPDGCIAMSCLHCSQAFCWMCFAECDGDAHHHAITVHGDYFPPLRAVESWHTRWRWRRIARLVVDGLPSRAARDDTEVGTLTVAQAEQLAEAAALLRDFNLHPFPREQPVVWDDTLRSALLTAVLANSEERVRAALDSGERIDELDERGMSALMHAAHQGFAEMVHLVLRCAREAYDEREGAAGADGAADPRAAARAADAMGVFVALPDFNGLTALMYACREGRVAAVMAVLDGATRGAGAALVLPLVSARDDQQMTAIAYAVRAAMPLETLQRLIAHGADAVTVGPPPPPDADRAAREGRWRGGSAGPLGIALQAGHSEDNQQVVRLLLEHVLRNPPADDRTGWPPAWAEYADGAAVQAERLRLAARAANDNASLSRAYRHGLTSASTAVQRLLELPGIDIDALEPIGGWSALAHAASQGDAPEVAFLLSKGARGSAEASARVRRGRDALAEAFRGGHNAVVELLLATPTCAPSEEEALAWRKLNTTGRWLGRAACLDSAEQVRKWLVFAESNKSPQERSEALEYRGSDRFTAMHFAARHGSIAVVALLLRASADPFAKDVYGKFPHHYARLYRHEAVLRLLPALSPEQEEQVIAEAEARRRLEEEEEEEGMLYTFDMWDAWYEEQAAAEAAAAAAGAGGAVEEGGTGPTVVVRQLTNDEERAIRAEQERWRRMAALVPLAMMAQPAPHPLPPARMKTAPF